MKSTYLSLLLAALGGAAMACWNVWWLRRRYPERAADWLAHPIKMLFDTEAPHNGNLFLLVGLTTIAMAVGAALVVTVAWFT